MHGKYSKERRQVDCFESSDHYVWCCQISLYRHVHEDRVKWCFHCADNFTKIADGSFSSLVFNQNQLYAAECKTKELYIFHYRGGAWKKQRQFKLQYGPSAYAITIAVKGVRITCCSYGFDEIQVYSLAGKRLETYSTRDQMVTAQLGCPFICSSDTDGCVLLADNSSHRLQVMSEGGKFKSVPLEPQMLGPCAAAVYNSELYVASGHDDVIAAYSL